MQKKKGRYSNRILSSFDGTFDGAGGSDANQAESMLEEVQMEVRIVYLQAKYKEALRQADTFTSMLLEAQGRRLDALGF